MPVGRAEDEPCRRTVGQWGNTRICNGTITAMGGGHTDGGIGWRFIGCPRCGWTQKVRMPEPITEPLFGDLS